MSQLSFLENQVKTEEFLLVIQPDLPIAKQILAMKRSFAERYQARQALYSSSGIVLGTIHILPERRNELLEMLEGCARDIQPFNIRCKNFGGWGGHSIYIDLENPEDIYNLSDHILMHGTLFSPGLLNHTIFYDHSCIFIAKRLNTNQYRAASNEFRYRTYSGQWEMKQWTLLRKNPNTNRYEKVQDFKCRRHKRVTMTKVS